jgi:hypothetical protein
MLFTVNVDPIAGSGVAVAPVDVGLTVDVPPLPDDVHPAIATAMAKTPTTIKIDGIYFMKFPHDRKIT